MSSALLSQFSPNLVHPMPTTAILSLMLSFVTSHRGSRVQSPESKVEARTVWKPTLDPGPSTLDSLSYWLRFPPIIMVAAGVVDATEGHLDREIDLHLFRVAVGELA